MVGRTPRHTKVGYCYRASLVLACVAPACRSVGVKQPHHVVDIAGAQWEFTPQFDCWHYDAGTLAVQVWGQEGAEEDRATCAQRCLETEDCVAFNFPNEEFPDKFHPLDPQACYLKRVAMHSKILGVECEKASVVHVWQYYSLLDHNVWARMSVGYRKSNYPFYRPLEVDRANVAWINDVRWLGIPGRNCQGESVASYDLKAIDDGLVTLQDCASRCVEHQNCMGFELPNDSNGDNKDNKCTLKAFNTSDISSTGRCNGWDPTVAWTSFTLVDAWHVRLDKSSKWVRINKLDKWSGSTEAACSASSSSVGQWLSPTGEQKSGDKGEFTGCCAFELHRCNTTENCKPYLAHPSGCQGLCKTAHSSCECWSQQHLPVKKEPNCCTSCSLDCKGHSVCFPADCDASTMCSSLDQMGSGAVCVCAAHGTDPKKVVVPQDVAAGWNESMLMWA